MTMSRKFGRIIGNQVRRLHLWRCGEERPLYFARAECNTVVGCKYARILLQPMEGNQPHSPNRKINTT